MSSDPIGWQGSGESPEEGELGYTSGTRIRAASPEAPASPNAPDSKTLTTAVLAEHTSELHRLARRLKYGRAGSFMTSWLEHCGRSPKLLHEDADYVAAVQRTAGPLLDSLEAGQFQLAELHASELFADLRTLSLGVGAVLDVIAAFEQTVSALSGTPESQSTVQALGRFLTCAAFSVINGPTPAEQRPLLESSERLRPTQRRAPVRFRQLIGDSLKMQIFRAQLEDVASAPGSVLIVGESGSGKELVAEAIHQLGDFGDEPFIPVNCAALPRELIESELFGHERGAFTGSREAAPGLLRAAGRGTVFLDEITEMPQQLQPKLLRALEQRAVRPVGGLREVPIHARIVAATNADPERADPGHSLRLDLFYRLCVHRVDVPPLRERLEDIPALIDHFLSEAAKAGHRVPRAFSAASLGVLASHAWSGNVRELRNVVEHSCATCKDGLVEPRHLPQRLLLATQKRREEAPTSTADSGDAPDSMQLKLVERRHIEHVLRLSAGNKAQAARLLGLSRHQLYLKLERLGLGNSED